MEGVTEVIKYKYGNNLYESKKEILAQIYRDEMYKYFDGGNIYPSHIISKRKELRDLFNRYDGALKLLRLEEENPVKK